MEENIKKLFKIKQPKIKNNYIWVRVLPYLWLYTSHW
ncbi:UNVERIFIED_ORG: hypothetical protein ABID36_001124 [Streptococcus infantarius]